MVGRLEESYKRRKIKTKTKQRKLRREKKNNGRIHCKPRKVVKEVNTKQKCILNMDKYSFRGERRMLMT